MKKPYKKPENEDMIAKEPLVEYQVSGNVQSSCNKEDDYLPKELLINVVEYTGIARKQKRMTPNDEVYDILAAKFEWK